MFETLALMAAKPQTLPSAASDGVAPEWVHLLPAPVNGLIATDDARGPYTAQAAEEIIANTFAKRDRLEIDINHATFLAGPKGGRSDAVGWIVEMQAREDGIWGKVEWTDEGRRLVVGRAYRGISPVLLHDTNKKIVGLANASLVNRPNLQGLTTLHQQQDTAMDWTKYLAELLGLGTDATDAQVKEALKTRLADKAPDAAMQAQMTAIGAALGLASDAGPDAIVAAAQAAQAAATAEPEEIVALQSEITSLTTRLNTMTEDRAREQATAFVDGEIKKGRAGLKPVRDRYISLHMKDAAEAEALIGAMPILTASGTTVVPPPPSDGSISLNAAQAEAARHLGIDPDTYKATLQAERTEENRA